MLPGMKNEAVQERLRQMHEQALHADTPIDDSIDLLTRAAAGYDTSFNQARAHRDLGKYVFRAGGDTWHASQETSLRLLEQARRESDADHARTDILREEGATHGMYGRLVLKVALESHDLADYNVAAIRLGAAKQKIKEASGKKFRPDQYEINFAAARAVSERYDQGYGHGLLALGRAALIAGMSESRLARHRNPNLNRQERKDARKRSLGRAAFAVRVVVMPDWYSEREAVRQRTAKIVA